MTSSFKEFNFSETISKAIEDVGYETATAIQADVIPHILQGSDVIAKAQTGSGKTAAFGLPALELLANNPKKTILVLTPTRELALQVCSEMVRYAKHMGILPTSVYGGEALFNQLKRLKRDSRVIVGTPGRLLDLFQSGHLTHFKPETVVLDEADEMLNMGFLEDIQEIFSYLPNERQTLLFSATLSKEIRGISNRFLTDPVSCDQTTEERHEDIEQLHYLIPERQRESALLQLLQYHNPTKAIVFCNTKRQVEDLSEQLKQSGFGTLQLHGDMSQADRQRSINGFRKAPKKILVATDVAGRGINVTDVTHVVNLELPFSPECYTHRIGRTGRMGNKGTAITLVTPKQQFLLKRFLKTKMKNIQLSKLPSPEDVKHIMKRNFTDKLQDEYIHQDAEEILTLLKEGNQIEEITLKLISHAWRGKAQPTNRFVVSPSAQVESSGKSSRGGRSRGRNFDDNSRSGNRKFRRSGNGSGSRSRSGNSGNSGYSGKSGKSGYSGKSGSSGDRRRGR
ncbi:MAG: DEAD-box ATP-dependent RNA helicase RhpA [Chlamydiia bacterium]|nr:DEAD-box ATP-dependent RNA helicase RhpA [Chlamydiia bacterium]